MIATINVTSATSSGEATKAHIPDTGGMNIAGRMAELDFLFCEAGLDIIAVQESGLPQTQILQTRDYTVFNSGASPGEHHYGVHVFVLHAPCEVAAPHNSDAFYVQVHERMNAVPRGQLCLLLGDFIARVGSIAAGGFGKHAPVSENQNGERMRELLTEINIVALNTFFPGDPNTWTKVSGRHAFICASSELLAATRWTGVRKDIDVRVGSAEDHWPVVTSRSESQEKTKECKQRLLTATMFTTNKEC